MPTTNGFFLVGPCRRSFKVKIKPTELAASLRLFSVADQFRSVGDKYDQMNFFTAASKLKYKTRQTVSSSSLSSADNLSRRQVQVECESMH